MKVSFDKLLRADQKEQSKYINFFNTFGYLHITNALSLKLSAQARREYKRVYEEKNKKRWRNIMKTGVQFFIPNFYEESKFFATKILLEKIHPIANILSDGRAIYLGSDGSCFNGQSFQWHRDWFSKARMLKFNIYLNNNYHIGGRHLLIPGSQFTTDEFSQSIGRGGAWPFFPQNYGWLNENEFFPSTPAPRDHALKRIWRKFRGDNYLPYVAIRPKPTDIILFDQRTWHMVEKPFPAIPQLLATGLFAVHPESERASKINHDSSDKNNSKDTNEQLEELASLYVGERKMINCTNYGKYFENISPQILHFEANKSIKDCNTYEQLEVKLSDNSFRMNMYEKMGSYSKLGRAARANNQDLSDGYSDEMLGINYSNIADYHKCLNKPGRSTR